jgi:hypothetical protein
VIFQGGVAKVYRAPLRRINGRVRDADTPGIEMSVEVGSVDEMHGALVLMPVGGLIVAALLLIVIRRSTGPANTAGGWAAAMPAQPPAQPASAAPDGWMPERQLPPTWRPAD